MLDLGEKRFEIKGDSKLEVKQLTKEYKCIKENLLMYFVTVNLLLKRFDLVEMKHVPRIENQEASDLAHIASRYIVCKGKL